MLPNFRAIRLIIIAGRMAGRLFISRLDEARSPAAADKTPEIGRRPRTRTEEVYDMPTCLVGGDTAKAGPDTPRIKVKNSNQCYGDNSEILEKLAEYLFDLFDANVMEDYAKMEKFEIRALESFQNFDQTEFTHEQHALHREFVALFEQLIEGFLASEGYAIEKFYAELDHFLKKAKDNEHTKPMGLPLCPADEVMEVISNYMQFEVWADLMRHQARQQAEFKTLREKLEAVHLSSIGHEYQAQYDSAMSNIGDSDDKIVQKAAGRDDKRSHK